MNEGLRTLLATAAGVLAALLIASFTNWQNIWRDRLTWKAALRGEIGAIVSVVTNRRLTDLVEMKLKETQDSGKTCFPQFSAKGQYFTIFHSSASTGKLGTLGPLLASEITRFYLVATSVVEDLNYMAEAKPADVPIEQALSEMMQLRDSLKEMIEIGTKVSPMNSKNLPH